MAAARSEPGKAMPLLRRAMQPGDLAPRSHRVGKAKLNQNLTNQMCKSERVIVSIAMTSHRRLAGGQSKTDFFIKAENTILSFPVRQPPMGHGYRTSVPAYQSKS